MIFELAQDFHDAAAAMPRGHPKQRMLELLEEAVRRDIHFIARHPTTMFQCMWNTCWWYDCPAAEKDYAGTDRHWSHSVEKFCHLLQRWRTEREHQNPGFQWLRSLRAPVIPIGSARRAALRGHDAPVSCVEFSRDGRQLVTGSQDDTVRVWDIETLRQVHCLREHSSDVVDVSFSPDGTRIASAGRDQTVRIWDAGTGLQLTCLLGHEAWLTTVEFSPDGRRIASGSEDKTVRIWDPLSGRQLFCLRHQAKILSVAYSPDGRRILSTSDDGALRIWNSENGIQVLSTHHGPYLRCAVFSPDGREFASATWDSISLCDSETGEVRRTLPNRWVECLSYSPDGHRIVAGTYCQPSALHATLHIWDIPTGGELRIVHGIQAPVWCVAYSPNGTLIATAAGAYSTGAEDWAAIWLWDARLSADVPIMKGHAARIRGIFFSLDGERIATDGHDKTIREWDCASGTEILCYRGEERTHFPTDKFARVVVSQGCLEAKTSFADDSRQGRHPGYETVVYSTTSARPLVWFPIGFEQVGLHPSGRILVGSAHCHLYIFRVEGRLPVGE